MMGKWEGQTISISGSYQWASGENIVDSLFADSLPLKEWLDVRKAETELDVIVDTFLNKKIDQELHVIEQEWHVRPN